MASRRLQLIRALHHVPGLRESSHLIRSYSNYTSGASNGLKCSFNTKSFSPNLYNGHNAFHWTSGKTMTVRSAMAAELAIFMNERRMATTQANAPAQARKMLCWEAIGNFSLGSSADPSVGIETQLIFALRVHLVLWNEDYTPTSTTGE